MHLLDSDSFALPEKWFCPFWQHGAARVHLICSLTAWGCQGGHNGLCDSLGWKGGDFAFSASFLILNENTRPRPPHPQCRSCRRTRSSSRALAADLRRYLSSSQGRPRPHLNNEIKRSWGPVYKSSHYWWCNIAAVVPRKSEPFSDAAALLSPATRTFEVWTYLVTANGKYLYTRFNGFILQCCWPTTDAFD